VVVLSVAGRAVLEASVAGYTAPFWLAQRAQIVLLAADDVTNADIGRRLGVDAAAVSKWRKRFVTEGLAGLKDRPRSGRPRRFRAEAVAGVKAMACRPPAARKVPLSRWSSAELAAQARHARLLRRLRRAPGAAEGPGGAQDRDRPVRRARGAGQAVRYPPVPRTSPILAARRDVC
jgi:transposase